jgi:high-affinity Fe2+/Pb2+ permease
VRLEEPLLLEALPIPPFLISREKHLQFGAATATVALVMVAMAIKYAYNRLPP